MKLKCLKCGKETEVANLATNSVCSCGEPLKTVSMGLQFNEKDKSGFCGLRHLMSDLVERQTLEGVDYLVVPTILIVEGVHNNVYYPASELEKFPDSWNGRPVVINHPDLNGQAVTANSPDIVERQTVGSLFNVKFEDGKLKGEVWINIEKCRKISEDILNQLHNNEKIEVSTGLFTECDGVGGEWNGEKYVGTVFNYRPDHLALLPNDIGACSWDDGGGMPRINERGEGKGVGGDKQGDGGTDSCTCPECGATASHNRGTPCTEMSCPKCGAAMTGVTQKNEENGNENINRNEIVKLIQAMSTNELSHSDVWSALSALLDNKFGIDIAGGAYVVEIFDGHFIYAKFNDGVANLFKQNYIKNADGSLEFDGDFMEVKEVREFVPVTTNEKTDKESKMDKAKFVADLIANSDWTEDDKELLLDMSEEQLNRLSPVVNAEGAEGTEKVKGAEGEKAPEGEEKPAEGEKPAENKGEEKPVRTPDDLIANIEDPEIKATLNRALTRDRLIKKEMVAELVKNEKCKYTEVQLNAKEIEELEILINMLGSEVKKASDFSPRVPAMNINTDDDAIPAMSPVFEKK